MRQPVLLLLSKTWGRYLDVIFSAFPQMLAFTASCGQLWALVTGSATRGQMPFHILVDYDQVSLVNIIAGRGKYNQICILQCLQYNLNKISQWNYTFANSTRIEVT